MTRRETANAVPFASLVCVAGLLGSQAMAEGVATTSVDLTVQVQVAERCGFASTAAAALVQDGFQNLRVGQARQVAMTLDCNVPFRIQARSSNGGLVPTGRAPSDLAAALRDGFNLRLPYSVSLDMPLSPVAGAGVSAQGVRCDTSLSMTVATTGAERCALARNRGALFGGLTGAGPGTLTLTLNTITGMPIAGGYEDTLTINIEPAT